MMTWAESRLTVNQIKGHPFFYGADWNSLRHIEPPFVPHLQSITDTSYFPTDDLGNTPDQLERVEGVGAEKDLAFLGWVILRNLCLWPIANFKDRFTFKRFTGGAQASG
jgi:protein-serine/threonine kinase